MPCETLEIKSDTGEVVGQALICSRGRRRQKCSVPDCANDATKLCDFELTGAKAGKTCDRALCHVHARSPKKGVDYCPPHWEHTQREARAQMPTLSGVK